MSLPRMVFEDGAVLVVDKPAGLVVNRAESVKRETLQDWVERKFRAEDLNFKITSQSSKQEEEFVNRSGIVHRLDKETSGVLVIAKTLRAFDELKRQFKAREVTKMYKALVYGRLMPRKGIISVPVGRSLANRQKFAVRIGGKAAETKYKVEGYFKDESGGEYSLVELWPKTGRTHQIRVHLAYVGHPVVADERYGGRKRGEKDRSWWRRQFLQAKRLEFDHPDSGKRMSFEVELAEELKRGLRKLSRMD